VGQKGKGLGKDFTLRRSPGVPVPQGKDKWEGKAIAFFCQESLSTKKTTMWTKGEGVTRAGKRTKEEG